MPDVYTDDAAIENAGRAALVNDAHIVDDFVVIPVLIPSGEVSAWLAAYDPENAYSPSAGDSRTIARVVLDALAKFQGA